MHAQLPLLRPACSNIESLPGGFDALRRMYESSAAPLMDALEQGPVEEARAGGRQEAASTARTDGGDGGPDDAPLPNPWGGGGGGGDGDAGNPFAALAGMDLPGIGGGVPSMEELRQMVNDPFMSQVGSA